MSIDEFTKRLELLGTHKQKESTDSSHKNTQKIIIAFGLNTLEISLSNKD